MLLAERHMHRKLTSTLSYAHALKPLMTETFAVPRGIPDAMSALLAQLDQAPSDGRSQGERMDAIKLLMEAEERDAQAASPSKN